MSGVIILLLAAVFLIAAISKLRSPNEFGDVLRNFMPASLVTVAALGVPLAELALALFLLSGIASRSALISAMGLLVVFTVVLVVMSRRGVKGCGCFGESAETATSGSGIVRNIILIGLAGAVIGASSTSSLYGPDVSTTLGRVTIVAGVLCLWPCLVALFERRKLIFNFSKT